MRIQQRVTLAFVILIGLQLLTAGAAVGLLMRMEPAIEAILSENEDAIGAVGDLLETLAEAEGGPVLPGDRPRATAALQVLERRVSGPGERATVERLRRELPAALDGDRAARVRVLAALERLGDANLSAMKQEDTVARRLGLVGAWTAAALGIASIGVGAVIRRRIAAELEDPLAELDGALAAAAAGDAHRRVAVAPEVAPEVARVGAAVNDLLDRRVAEGTTRALALAAADRAALLYLADEVGTGLAVVDAAGAVVAANTWAADLLAGEHGPRHRATLRNVASGGRPEGWHVVRAGPVWICRRKVGAQLTVPPRSEPERP